MTPETEHRAWAESVYGPERVHDGRISVIYLAKWLSPGLSTRSPGYAGCTQDRERELGRIFDSVGGRCLIIERPPTHPDADVLLVDSLDGVHSYNVPRRLTGVAFHYVDSRGARIDSAEVKPCQAA
jgi:hypothetical protein